MKCCSFQSKVISSELVRVTREMFGLRWACCHCLHCQCQGRKSTFRVPFLWAVRSLQQMNCSPEVPVSLHNLWREPKQLQTPTLKVFSATMPLPQGLTALLSRISLTIKMFQSRITSRWCTRITRITSADVSLDIPNKMAKGEGLSILLISTLLTFSLPVRKEGLSQLKPSPRFPEISQTPNSCLSFP